VCGGHVFSICELRLCCSGGRVPATRPGAGLFRRRVAGRARHTNLVRSKLWVKDRPLKGSESVRPGLI
jgi:hypothetical protein